MNPWHSDRIFGFENGEDNEDDEDGEDGEDDEDDGDHRHHQRPQQVAVNLNTWFGHDSR